MSAVGERDDVGDFPPVNNPCTAGTGPFASQPWCNASLPLSVRLDDMVKRMSISEKVATLDTGSAAIPSLGCQTFDRTARLLIACRPL